MNARQGIGSELDSRCRWRGGIKEKRWPIVTGNSVCGRTSRQLADIAPSEEDLG